MNPSIIFGVQLFLLFLLVLFSAFFSGSETALFSLSRARLLSYRTDPLPSRRLLSRLMESYNRTLIALVLGNMFVNVGLSVVGSELLGRLEFRPWLSMLTSIFVVIVLLLVFGEVTPKTLALCHAEIISRRVAYPVWYLRRILSPLLLVAEKFFAVILDILGRRRSSPLRPEEYDAFVEMAYSIGAFSDEEAVLLENIFALRRIKVGQIMTPRVDVSFVRRRDSPVGISRLIREACVPFLPVVDEDIDDASCILSARDFFALPRDERGDWHRRCVFEAVFVPENAHLLHALRALKAKDLPMGMVTDEFGGIVGVVSTEDIYEEIVGDIEDEHELSDWQLHRVDPNIWQLSGQISISDLEELLGWKLLVETEANTLNGLFSSQLDRLPELGDEVEFPGVRMKALAVAGNRVVQVALFRHSDPGGDS